MVLSEAIHDYLQYARHERGHTTTTYYSYQRSSSMTARCTSIPASPSQSTEHSCELPRRGLTSTPTSKTAIPSGASSDVFLPSLAGWEEKCRASARRRGGCLTGPSFTFRELPPWKRR